MRENKFIEINHLILKSLFNNNQLSLVSQKFIHKKILKNEQYWINL